MGVVLTIVKPRGEGKAHVALAWAWAWRAPWRGRGPWPSLQAHVVKAHVGVVLTIVKPRGEGKAHVALAWAWAWRAPWRGRGRGVRLGVGVGVACALAWAWAWRAPWRGRDQRNNRTWSNGFRNNRYSAEYRLFQILNAPMFRRSERPTWHTPRGPWLDLTIVNRSEPR